MRFRLTKRFNPIQVPPYKKRLLSTVVAGLIFLLVSLISFYIIDFKLRPTLSAISEIKIRQHALHAIHETVRVKIGPKIDYQSLININFDKDGRVAFMQSNTGAINRISAEATQAIQQQLYNLPGQKISIPLGEALGIKLLANLGPYLPVKIMSIGFVDSTIEDGFKTAGINQVHHQIYLKVNTNLRIVVPLARQTIDITTKIPLVEGVVIGEVPNVYSENGGLIIPNSSNLIKK